MTPNSKTTRGKHFKILAQTTILLDWIAKAQGKKSKN
jgi:hypothetical protein